MPSKNGQWRYEFLKIPQILATDTTLSPYAKLVFAALAVHGLASGRIFPGFTCLSKDVGCSYKTVCRAILELERAGHLTRDRQGGKSYLYTLMDYGQDDYSQDVHSDSSYSQNVHRCGQDDQSAMVILTTERDTVEREQELDPSTVQIEKHVHDPDDPFGENQP